jgi:hypothetical protein
LVGRVETLDNRIKSLDDRILSLNVQIDALGRTIVEKNAENEALNHFLEVEKDAHQAVLNSRSWRIMQGFQRVRKMLIPEGSRRETYFHKLFRS